MAFKQEAPDEAALIARSLEQDREAFGRLVEHYAEPVFNVAKRLVGDTADAADIAQEAFLASYRALPRFRREARFSTWLYRIVVNKCHDWLRVRRTRAEVFDAEDDKEFEVATLAIETETPEQVLSRKELGMHLEDVLQTLPLLYREAFILKHVEGLSYEEMSKILGVGGDALKMRVYKARSQLRQKLAHLQDKTSSVTQDQETSHD